MIEEDVEAAITRAIDMLQLAQANISGHKVGAVVIAENVNGAQRYFSGCNIELATSKCWHAEETALINAITHGFRKPLACFVTSNNVDQRAAMCGYCMQTFMYANPKCLIYVIDTDGSIKLVTTVEERNGPLAYHGKGRLDE
jgi:cytidine deaminase